MKHYFMNPKYFLNYFLVNLGVFVLLTALLWNFRSETALHFSFQIIYLLLVPVGIIFGLMVSTAFHNASHGNIKPLWLNKTVGEFTGAYTLEGMRNFQVGHMLHHKHTDDPELDPHPPHGQTFLKFIFTSRNRTIECLKKLYFQHHGNSFSSRLNISLQILVFNLSALFKLAFWFLLLGPTLFIFFFVPSYLAYFFGFGHLNWISHLDDPGETNIQIKDHDGGVFYSVMNLITSGGYYHKSHHRFPGYYNPRHAPK